MLYTGNKQKRPYIWSHERIITPERKLWRAVLTQGLEDAEMTPVGDEAEGEPLETSRARRYLRADSAFEAEDLKLVCDFAELPADRVFLLPRRSYPPEPTLENHVESGGSPPPFLPVHSRSPAALLV